MENNEFAKSLIRRERKSDEIKKKSYSNKVLDNVDLDGRETSKYIRPVIVNTRTTEFVNTKIVSYELYNCFNYSLFLTNEKGPITCSLGVTSPNTGEGKTTSACNLAASLAMGLNRKTVIIDLNFNNPSIHEIFGITGSPGLSEALLGEEIFVTPTQIENLSVMPAGHSKIIPAKRLSYFNEIAASLMKEFEFLIIDMPPVNTRSFPTLIANQLTGLIVVIEARKTKRRDIDRMFRQVNERNVVGFVLNKISENDF